MLAKSVLFAFIAIFAAPRLWHRYKALPVYENPHPYFNLRNLWSEEDINGLRSMVKDQKKFYTAIEDVTTTNLEISAPVNEDGSCPHKFLAKTKEDKCIMPQRVDIFAHYAKTGGRYGAKEPFERLVNNIQSLQTHLFGDDLKRPEMSALFNSPQYAESSAAVCGEDHPIHQRVQVNLIAMMPGQDLPIHYDLPWFKNGANRHNTPQWLLLAMAGSGLWDDYLLPQVQGVAYIHMNKTIDGGEFFLFPNGPGSDPVVLSADSNSAVVVNGIKVIHGVQRFLPGRVSPPVGKKKASLKYTKVEDVWILRDDQDQVLEKYQTHDLRLSLVWRTLCFKNEEEQRMWNPQNASYDTEEALTVLEEDLRKRGVLAPNEPRPPLLDLALLLLDEYVQYPVDNLRNAWFPYNFCMLPYATTQEFVRTLLHTLVSFIC